MFKSILFVVVMVIITIFNAKKASFKNGFNCLFFAFIIFVTSLIGLFVYQISISDYLQFNHNNGYLDYGLVAVIILAITGALQFVFANIYSKNAT